MSKVSSKIEIIIFALFIGALFLLFAFMPKRTFSEQENRELVQAPAFSFEALASGRFTSRFESFTTDQFPFRDSWTTLKAGSELALGKKENNSVYYCADDTIFERFDEPDRAKLDSDMTAVNTFTENTPVPVYFSLIIGSAEIYRDMLPYGAPNADQRAAADYCYGLSEAQNIDLYETLFSHRDEYIFYRTDHHWTSLGAYYAYAAMMEGMGLVAPPLSDYDRQTVTEEFYGTVYSKSGFSWIKPDSMEIFVPQEETTQVFNYPGADAEAGVMYDYSFLERKDKYSMFMGGITPLLKVTTAAADKPVILIIRDSFTDSLLPFLQDDFSEIHVMDLRYYKTRLVDYKVSDYVKDNGIDVVYILYSIYNFATDVNISLLS